MDEIGSIRQKQREGWEIKFRLVCNDLAVETNNSRCCLLLSSWSQSDLLLARRPWGQHAEVDPREPAELPLPQPAWLRHGGGRAGRRRNREAQVQQPTSHLRAAAAAASGPGAVYQRDLQRVWFHGESDRWRPGAEHTGALQQVPCHASLCCCGDSMILLWF